MLRFALLRSCLLASLLCSPFADAQTTNGYLNDTGATAYGINIPVEGGYINMSNGNLHMEFPVVSPPQRGALGVTESIVYDSRIWQFLSFGTNGSYHWWPYNVYGSSHNSGGWRFVTSGEVGTVSYTSGSTTSNSCGGVNDPGGSMGSSMETIHQSNVIWTDPGGLAHIFNATLTTDENDCTGTYTNTISGGYAADASGYTIPSDPNGNIRVIDSNGTQVYPTLIDRFGNYLSSDSNGNLIDDTGRTPVIVTQNGNTTYYDVFAPNGPIQNNGTRVRYTVVSASVPVSTSFLPYSQSDIYPWNPSNNYLTPVQSIQLPDGSQYSFTYDNNGEVSSVTLPTGGVIHYGYTDFVDSSSTENNWLTSRTKGSDPSMTIKPVAGSTCANYSTGCLEFLTLHKPSGDETLYELTLANGAWNTYEAAFTGAVPPPSSGYNHNPVPDPPSSGMLYYATNTNQYSNATCYNGACTGANYLTSTLKSTILTSGGNPTIYTQAYSTFDPVSGKPTAVKEWDFAAPVSNMNTTTPPSTTPTRETDYSYTGYDPYQIKVLDSAGNQAGLTTYSYTYSATATSGLTGHGTANAGGPYLQSVAHWLNTDGSSPATTYGMDDSGMVLTTTDANGNPPTTISYQCNNSLPYQAKNALGQTTQYGYDCNSGAPTSVQDPNDQAAQRAGIVYAYEGTAGRLQSVTVADGGVTTYAYPSVSETDITVNATPDPSIFSRSILDSYGRPVSQITGGVETDTSYDTNGRVSCVTNPYTTGTGTPASTCTSAYDGLDRPLTQALQDGVSTRSWSYSSNSVTSTDEKGASWTRTSDAFGKLLSVTEPGNLVTSYSYNGLGKLTGVNQAGSAAAADVPRPRSYTYDSLARLVCAANPESITNMGVSCPGNATAATPGGAIGYTYYPGGNIRVRTDARGIATTYAYDSLNRVTSRTYSDGTPTQYIAYDGKDQKGGTLSQEGFTANNTIGRISFSTDQTAAAVAYSYDAVGRITQQQQYLRSTNQYTAISKAAYDLAGSMTDLTYPDGRHITQTFDAVGRLATSNLVDINGTSASQSYVGSVVYNPDDPSWTLTLGNNVVVKQFENARLQASSMTAKATGAPFSGQTLLSHTYCYSNCATGGTANAGTIWGITDTLNGARTQGYTYDALNRINSFYLGGAVAQQYSVDSFGNLSGVVNGQPTQTFPGANNRISLSCASPAYDQAGNQLCGNNAAGNGTLLYTYTAENQLSTIRVQNTASPFESYIYNGDGERTEKLDGNGNVLADYVFFGGQTVAVKQGGAWTDYIYANGQQVAMEGPVSSIWMHGSNSSPVEAVINMALSHTISIASGDKLSWTQSQQSSGGTSGGLNLTFENGWQLKGSCGSCSGQPAAAEDQNGTATDKWTGNFAHEPRTVDLSAFAGHTVTGAQLLKDINAPGGSWDLTFSFISITHANGSVDTIFDGVHQIGLNMPAVNGMSNNWAQYLGAVDGSSTRFYVADQVGSAQLELAPGGWPLSLNRFTPFGTTLDTTQTPSTGFLFAGLEHDGETGLDHAHFRQLAAYQGRWTSPDPYDGSMNLGDPQSLNRYSYVGNEPLNFYDSMGLDREGSGSGGLGSVGGCIGAVASGGTDIPGDIGCAVQILYDFFSSFFSSGPRLTATTKPRPIWDEHGSYRAKPYSSISDILGLPQQGCEFGVCGSSFTDYNREQTSNQLQTAFNEVTAGRIIGLLNIKNHSCGECKYDYGWNSHSADTWNICGRTFNADQMGNFMAGYQAGVYDKNYFWTTGAIWAQGSVDAAGVIYHMTGRTKATSDPIDRTGMPDILRGQRYARHGCSAM